MARLRGSGPEELDPTTSFAASLAREHEMNGGSGLTPAPDQANVGGWETLAREGSTPRENFADRAALSQVGGSPSVQMRTPTGPFDNGEHANDNSGGSTPTPVRPRSPQPMAGAVSQVSSGDTSSPSTGVMPFTPMGAPDIGSAATPRGAGGLFGSLGGLKGGGLGLPLDPLSNQLSDPISDLIKKVMGGGGGY